MSPTHPSIVRSPPGSRGGDRYLVGRTDVSAAAGAGAAAGATAGRLGGRRPDRTRDERELTADAFAAARRAPERRLDGGGHRPALLEPALARQAHVFVR